VEQWPDGRIKLYTIHRALTYRRAAPDLFRAGEYVPLRTEGVHAGHLCAFARRQGTIAVLTVVPRLTAGLTDNGARLPLGNEVWGDTSVALPEEIPRGPYINLFTGAEVRVTERDSGRILAVGEILGEFPAALLEAPALAPVGPGER
jgi:(1->4)-alpha-D-glucan 1-alpha-D-glucosylmutase